MTEALMTRVKHFLADFVVTCPNDDAYYNAVKLFGVLLATSTVDKRIAEVTCHNLHEWDLIIREALNAPSVQVLLGDQLTQELLNSEVSVSAMIPQYFREVNEKLSSTEVTLI